jgi:predicted HTH domain antitoxin
LAVSRFFSLKASLGRGAEIAGLDRWQFQDILHERYIPILIEAESVEAMDNELAVFYNGQK